MLCSYITTIQYIHDASPINLCKIHPICTFIHVFIPPIYQSRTYSHTVLYISQISDRPSSSTYLRTYRPYLPAASILHELLTTCSALSRSRPVCWYLLYDGSCMTYDTLHYSVLLSSCPLVLPPSLARWLVLCWLSCLFVWLRGVAVCVIRVVGDTWGESREGQRFLSRPFESSVCTTCSFAERRCV